MQDITRRSFLKSMGVAAAGMALGRVGLGAELPNGGGRPNFVIILTDDIGYGDLSCYGGRIKTPCLEQLAAEGVKFTDFHSSGVVCSPTRAGLMTGRYQQRAGVADVLSADPKDKTNSIGLDPGEITFPKLLKAAGYATGIFGKWHLGYTTKYSPIRHGFDRFRGYVSGNITYNTHLDRMGNPDWWNGLDKIEEEGYSTHLITRHSVKFIEENKDKPFCMYVAHEAVHTPLDPPRPEKGEARPKGKRDAYAEAAVEMDKGVGEILAALKKAGVAEKTLVFFFSDNGATRQGSNAPFRGFKRQVWEGGHRVPGLAWWPGKIKPGAVTDQLAISLDIMPTMLELADVKLPAGHKLDGMSLAPLLLNGKSLGGRKLFWDGLAMRDDQWKLVVDGKKHSLFNLNEDIGEKDDIADKDPQRAARMLDAIRAWKKDVGATSDGARDEE